MKLQEIEHIFKNASKYNTLNKVGVFGSFARNEQTKNSDIDIILEYKPPVNEEDDEYIDHIGGFMEDIEEFISLKIDYITLNGLQRSKNEDFRNAILKDVRWLYVAKTENI